MNSTDFKKHFWGNLGGGKKPKRHKQNFKNKNKKPRIHMNTNILSFNI